MQKYTKFDAQSFKDAMICNMDSIRKYMLEIILHQQRTPQLLKQKKLMQTQKDHSNPIPALNVDSLKVDVHAIKYKMSKACSLDSVTKDVHAIKYKMSKAKERCMAYFRSLHSHLQVLSKEDLKGTRIENGFKRAFISLSGQDVDNFTSTMLLNFSLDYDSQMTDKYFVEYTGIEVKHFRDTLLQHMVNVKKSVAERTLDVDLVVTENSGTESEVQDDSSRLGNDTDADDADIRPIYDEEPVAEVQLTAECNIYAIGQQHTEQPEIINEGRVDQYPEQRQVKSHMLDSSPDNQTTDYSKQSLESENILFKKTVAQFQKDFSRKEAHCIALELKYQYQALKSRQHGQILNETSNKAKNKKEIDVLEIMKIELEHSLAKLHKENETLKKHYKDLFQSTADGSKPKPRSTNHSTRSLPVSKSSCVTITAVPKADHSKSSSSFSDSKHFVYSTCHKCVFNANHDACITKLLKEVNSHAKIQSHKTRNNNKPVDQNSHTRKPSRQWITYRMLFRSCTARNDSEPTLGSNVDISNIHESKQTLDLSAGTSINVQKEQSLDLSAELESVFGPLFDEYLNGENQVVLKSSAVTTADASDKRQQQPDSTSSTSTLATSVTADGNFDL
ncbi:hypothetical protein Tco_0664040 [Tanacetum coccineum]